MTTPHPKPLQSKKQAWLIGAIPVLPLLYLAAFSKLGFLKYLKKPVLYVLAFFIGTQLLAAFFTPHPELSVPTALLRCLWLLAMLSAGIYLGNSEKLRPMLFGYMVVFITAWFSTLTTLKFDLHQLADTRLLHPYYYFVSIGLLCAIAGWQIISWRTLPTWFKIAASLLTLVTLLATGSRGGLLAFLVGTFAAAARGNKRYLYVSLTMVTLGLVTFFSVPQIRDADVLSHLASFGLSGRNEVWQGAINAFKTSPVGGVGPYQLGPYLTFMYKDGCNLTPLLIEQGIGCPAWLESFRGAWLHAHNIGLHLLGETGVIGVLGWLALFILSGIAAWKSKNSLIFGLFSGFMAMNLIDITSLGPSTHWAELFWASVGIALRLSGYTTLSGSAPDLNKV